MAWNRPSEDGKIERGGLGKARPRRLGLIAVAVVAALCAAVGAYFLLRDSGKPVPKVPEKPSSGKIAEVAPAATNRAGKAEEPAKPLTAEEKRLKEIAEIEARYAGKEMPNGIATHLYYLKNPPKISITTKRPYDCFAYTAERSIASLVLAEPGTEFLDQLEFGASFDNEFVNALLAKNEPAEGDDEKTLAMKSAVDEAKHEIARICREEGKKPSEVMNEYAKMMYDLGKFERNIREMVSEARRNPELSNDDVIDFLEAANKLREERGLPPFKIPSLAKRGLMLAHRAERLRSMGNGE